ncbi:MAG: hypothetical protein DRH07_01655 [Deltaproteobacteria bacterium]|nr:MAG: hypothetical protein DRH07_01655 [Deltaproteobacteria bacterium]
MAKQLVRRDNIEEFISHDENRLYVGQSLILTPGAKDYLQEKNITVVYGEPAEPKINPEAKVTTPVVTDLEGRIQQLLQSDFSITDRQLITEVTKKVLEKLENPGQ